MAVLGEIIRGCAWFAIVYFAVLNTLHLGLITLAAVNAVTTSRRRAIAGRAQIFGSPPAPGISMIVPARNEEAVVVACVYRAVWMVVLPYCAIFKLGSAVVELTGIAAFIVSLILGIVNPLLVLLFIVVGVGYATSLSIIPFHHRCGDRRAFLQPLPLLA